MWQVHAKRRAQQAVDIFSFVGNNGFFFPRAKLAKAKKERKKDHHTNPTPRTEGQEPILYVAKTLRDLLVAGLSQVV